LDGIKNWLGGAAIALALPLAAVPALVSPASADGPVAGGLENETQFRQQHQQEFIRTHSDTTGKFRPDLIRAAAERTKQMQVAPSIGAHPPALPAVSKSAVPK
jgi:hypothetical protein